MCSRVSGEFVDRVTCQQCLWEGVVDKDCRECPKCKSNRLDYTDDNPEMINISWRNPAYDGPMGIFTDYDFCNSETTSEKDAHHD